VVFELVAKDGVAEDGRGAVEEETCKTLSVGIAGLRIGGVHVVAVVVLEALVVDTKAGAAEEQCLESGAAIAAGVCVGRAYADAIGGVLRPVTAFWSSYSVIHDSSGLTSVALGVGIRSMSSSSIPPEVSRGLRPLKLVALALIPDVEGVFPLAPSLLLLDISRV
jgi:hypothetical protein